MDFFDLPTIWAGLLALAVIIYILLDGFDLGIGILFPFANRDEDRDVMMNSIAPVWDGNETWLVLGGGGLFAAFPKAYAALMPAVYMPIGFMLTALIFRGVAFEFRFKANTSRHWWDKAFHYGSLTATFAQGLVLGSFVQGFVVEGRQFAGGPFDWLTPFSLMTGLALVAGYGLLGATWLVMKTEGALQVWAERVAMRLLFAVLFFIVVVSLWTALLDADIAARWFSWPNILLLAPVPLVTALVAFALYRALEARWEILPFLLAMGLFLLCYIGLGVSLFPYIVPRAFTIWQAAAPPPTLIFTLYGVVIMIPAVLLYTVYSYYIFRGKVRAGEGYH